MKLEFFIVLCASCCYQLTWTQAAAILPLASRLDTNDFNIPTDANNNNNKYNNNKHTNNNNNIKDNNGLLSLERLSLPSYDLSEINDDGVYDPGDEILRTLNAEIASNANELGTLPEQPEYADTVFNELELANKYDMMRNLEKDLLNDQDTLTKSTMLMKLIEDPNVETMPLVYVESEPQLEQEQDDTVSNNIFPGIGKRSRYYRRYPWKRHSRNRNTYEPELRYACTPTKEDVFKLLVNLHENRKGNHSKTINFCNRKRPAKAIFTNIRFLG